jgi:transcriptional regulator with XRE-family HTH domain
MENNSLNYEKLGVRIREARKSKSYTQEKLSELVGISPNYLSRIETNNGGVVSLPTLVKICNALGVGMDYMLIDSLTASDLNFLSINALSEEDKKYMQIIASEFVKYKTNLLLTLKSN